MTISLPLTKLAAQYSILRLSPTAAVPTWALNASFFSITKTAEELSIVVSVQDVPEDAGVELIQTPFVCYKIEGPLDFSLVGIMNALTQPLSKAGISIFAVSTYDTDYLFIRVDKEEAAERVLTTEGHKITKGCSK